MSNLQCIGCNSLQNIRPYTVPVYITISDGWHCGLVNHQFGMCYRCKEEFYVVNCISNLYEHCGKILIHAHQLALVDEKSNSDYIIKLLKFHFIGDHLLKFIKFV